MQTTRQSMSLLGCALTTRSRWPNSMYTVVRYMISISAFSDTAATGKAVGLITGSFNAKNDAEYVMIDNAKALQCEQKFAETPTYVIVPSSCVASPKE